ncbi:MAG: rhomboid family intramembrane serine protease [Hyphomicrobiales bacterium]
MTDPNKQIAANQTPKRIVFFMSGYDRAGTARYHSIMSKQHRYYAKRFGVPMTVGPFNKNTRPQSHFSHFTIDAEWPEGNTTTNCYISDWQMEAQRDAEQSYFHRTRRYLYAYSKSWIFGWFQPIFKHQIRATILFSVPLIGLLARMLILSFFILAIMVIIRSFEPSPFVGAAIGGVIGALGILALRRINSYFKTLYEPHLADCITYFCKAAENDTQEIKTQADRFSIEMIDLIEQEKPDEVYIVSHSCGCFHSLPVHKAVLEARRSGKNYAAYEVTQITLSSLLAYSIIHKKSHYFRDLCVEMLEDSDTRWIEYFAPHDPFSIPQISMSQNYGFDLSTPLPAHYQVRSAAFGEIFSHKKLRKFKFNPLRMHFQYLTANDVAGSYDFFYIITHPHAFANNLNANIRIQPDS